MNQSATSNAKKNMKIPFKKLEPHISMYKYKHPVYNIPPTNLIIIFYADTIGIFSLFPQTSNGKAHFTLILYFTISFLFIIRPTSLEPFH